jgi:hypothetical protein
VAAAPLSLGMLPLASRLLLMPCAIAGAIDSETIAKANFTVILGPGAIAGYVTGSDLKHGTERIVPAHFGHKYAQRVVKPPD